jgi:hypothetical protein
VEANKQILVIIIPVLPPSLHYLLREFHPGVNPKGQSENESIIYAIINAGFRVGNEP